MLDKPSFNSWLAELRNLADNAGLGDIDDLSDEWWNYWNDGFTPSEALSDDLLSE